jgi:hypothetical protein
MLPVAQQTKVLKGSKHVARLGIPSNQVLSTNASCSNTLVDEFAMKITSRTAGMAMLTALDSSSNVLVVFCATDLN